MGGYLFFIFLLAFIKYGIFPFPKFIFGSYNTSEKLFKSFTHRAFLYGLSIFSFYASLISIGIIAYISLCFHKEMWFPFNNFFALYYVSIALFSIVWFSYHIAFETDSLKLIKARLSLYMAIHTTISIIIVLTVYENALKPFLSSTTLAFIWLTYLIDYKDGYDSLLENKITLKI
jgi:hypothetical protein